MRKMRISSHYVRFTHNALTSRLLSLTPYACSMQYVIGYYWNCLGNSSSFCRSWRSVASISRRHSCKNCLRFHDKVQLSLSSLEFKFSLCTHCGHTIIPTGTASFMNEGTRLLYLKQTLLWAYHFTTFSIISFPDKMIRFSVDPTLPDALLPWDQLSI
jgi:hypothetical protein